MATKREKPVSTKHKSDITYWMRFGLAVLSALICASLKLGIEGIAVTVAVYALSYVPARYLIEPEVSLGKYQVYLIGSTTFFITWITIWVLLYTLLPYP